MEIILKEYLWSKAYSEPCQISRMELFARIVNSILATKVYLRCFRGFWIRLWSEFNRHFLITYEFSESLKFGSCYIKGLWGWVQNKEYVTWRHFFVFVYYEICVFIIFISFYGKVSNFCNRILTNQKQELMSRNCQWNCMSAKHWCI